jgi:hypothetical protein
MNRSLKKCLFFVVILIAASIIISNDRIKSFSNENVSFTVLIDILSCKEVELDSSKNIFFLDTTSLAKNDTISPATLTTRQACSVESAAIMNPESFVFVIFLAKPSIENTETIKALTQHKNIIFLRIDFLEFVKNTVVEEWVAGGKIYNTKFLANNVSNLLRMMLLFM